MEKINAFKAYDIRGKVPGELNYDLAYKIGRAFSKLINCKSVVIGFDARKSSIELHESLSKGLTESGVDVISIGLCGTEMIYFATPFLNADGGIMITASHNPPEYNGMKFVKTNSVPVGYDSGLNEMEQMILKNDFHPLSEKKGIMVKKDVMNDFISNLKKFYSKEKIKPFNVVVNGGNGCVGLALDVIEKDLPIKMFKVFTNPDSNFPNGVPNPLLPENRKPTMEAVLKNSADLGVAWDGDYDRCFFFDEKGNFIEGYYLVGLLAKSILKDNPGGKIVQDPRLVWNTVKIVKENGGVPVQSVSGHVFIKAKMREVNSVYGGEMSAHHYFRENSYSDSGMIPFLLILQFMSSENKSLSQLVNEMVKEFPCSGEINSTISDPAEKIKEIDFKYPEGKRDYTDGLSVEYDTWRFNIRMSNTESIIRLNIETKRDTKLLKEKIEELLTIIRS
jgi:phosphomannomutase